MKANSQSSPVDSVKYRKGDWIKYHYTINGPEAAEYLESSIDYQRYIDKQIKPIADGILTFVNDSFDKVMAQQYSLFD
jgi:DNA polymerase-2